MRTVQIPGGTALVRDPEDIRGRDRLLVKAAAMAASSALAKLPPELVDPELSPEQVAQRSQEAFEQITLSWQESLAMLELRQATVVACLASWDLDLPLPTMETIGDLPGDLYDALEAAVGPVPDLQVDTSPSRDPQSPTSASESSNGLSEAAPASPPTPTSSSAGASTATESSTPG
jgi:hypothetical protein